MADGAPTVTLSVRAEHDAQLVDHRQIRRVGDDDDERPAVAAVRHEPVAKHQVRRDRPEQLLVDAELVHVDELEAIAFRELLGLRDLLGVVLRGLDEAFRFECGHSLSAFPSW